MCEYLWEADSRGHNNQSSIKMRIVDDYKFEYSSVLMAQHLFLYLCMEDCRTEQNFSSAKGSEAILTKLQSQFMCKFCEVDPMQASHI